MSARNRTLKAISLTVAIFFAAIGHAEDPFAGFVFEAQKFSYEVKSEDKSREIGDGDSRRIVRDRGYVRLADGVKVGVWESYINRSLYSRSTYSDNGKSSGSVASYHENGSVHITYKCVDGLAEGEMRVFDENGKLIRVSIMKNGKPESHPDEKR